MHNADVIRVLGEVADLLDIEGGNPFRIRAFRNAIELLENFPVDLAQHLEEGHALEELQGIGKGLARDIREILETGGCDAHSGRARRRSPTSPSPGCSGKSR